MNNYNIAEVIVIFRMSQDMAPVDIPNYLGPKVSFEREGFFFPNGY